MRKAALRLVSPAPVNGTVPPRRKPNSETRDREHLTEAEVARAGLAEAVGALGRQHGGTLRLVFN